MFVDFVNSYKFRSMKIDRRKFLFYAATTLVSKPWDAARASTKYFPQTQNNEYNHPMKNIIDLTIPLGPNTPIYPGDPIPKIDTLSSLDNGDILTASKINLGVHIGTHVDLPGHFIKGGKTLAAYSIEAFTGTAVVLDFSDIKKSISLDRVQRENIPEGAHILLKTSNSEKIQSSEFFDDYIYIEPEATAHLLTKKPASIGIDYYSLDPSDSDNFPSHKQCAENGLPVFVCLDLSKVEANKEYMYAGLPLHYPALEGVPSRVIVWAK